MTPLFPSIFRRETIGELNISDFSGGYNNRDDETLIGKNQLSDGQNILITAKGKTTGRKGDQLYGNYLGVLSEVLGGFNFVNRSGISEELIVYGPDVYRLVGSTWTKLTGGNFTLHNRCDGAYHPITDKFYITNGADDVLVYTSGGTITNDSNFKKGKYIEHYRNRLLVTIDDQVWYTDLGVDTFGANNYWRVVGALVGIKEYYDKIICFTKNKIFRVQNFTFNGVAAGPEACIELPVDFGAIYDRTIVKCDNLIYFLGQSQDQKCKIYKTDGYKSYPISDAIKNTLDGVATSQLQYACAGYDGRYYRLSVAESGKTVNNLEIWYDTIKNIFLPPIKRKNDAVTYSCLWTAENSGKWDLFGGTQSEGMVYKLSQTINYDELPEEKYTVAGSLSSEIDANPAKRSAQSFKLSGYNTTQSVDINSVFLKLKKSSGTTTDLKVRIETDNAGKPSGTLADPQAQVTLSAFTDTDYTYKKVAFSSVSLTGDTLYWLVVQHATEGSGNSKYLWGGDNCFSNYANGNRATYASGAWTADTSSDLNFAFFIQAGIDSYADSKAFEFDGKDVKVHKFLTKIKPSGNYNCEFGISIGKGFNNYLIDMSTDDSVTWGGGETWGGGKLWGAGQIAKNYQWRSVSGLQGKIIKTRIRNRNANEPFTYNGASIIYMPKFKMK